MQDDLDLGLGAGDVSHLTDRDAQGSAKKTTQVSRGVRKLVCLAVALIKTDKDAHVVLAGEDLDRGASELGRDLIETAGGDALLGAGDVESANRRVMGCLFGEV